jgi:hypothetical protein
VCPQTVLSVKDRKLKLEYIYQIGKSGKNVPYKLIGPVKRDNLGKE